MYGLIIVIVVALAIFMFWIHLYLSLTLFVLTLIFVILVCAEFDQWNRIPYCLWSLIAVAICGVIAACTLVSSDMDILYILLIIWIFFFILW